MHETFTADSKPEQAVCGSANASWHLTGSANSAGRNLQVGEPRLTECDRPRDFVSARTSAVRRADWRLTVGPMAMIERSDLRAAGDKQASACLRCGWLLVILPGSAAGHLQRFLLAACLGRG